MSQSLMIITKFLNFTFIYYTVVCNQWSCASNKWHSYYPEVLTSNRVKDLEQGHPLCFTFATMLPFTVVKSDRAIATELKRAQAMTARQDHR